MVEVVDKIEVRELDETVVLEEGDCAVDVPQELDEVGKTLLKARDYIREHGWTQNRYMDYAEECSFPAVCMVGALNWASGHAIDEHDSYLDSYKDRLGFVLYEEVFNWNDTTDRTQQEVEERLERAAYNL